MENYIYNSKAKVNLQRLTNCDLDIRKLAINEIPSNFEFRILYLVDNKGIALVLERFFTIFVNRMDNYIGFDLAINNYYNPIVGNLYFGKTLDIKPVDLIYAIRKYEMEDDILQNFNISSPNTLNKKLILFCIGIDIDGTLFDARAYVLKPFIELAFKKDMDIDDFSRLCFENNILFFENFSQKVQYLNKVCNHIWNDRIALYFLDERHNISTITYKRARKIFIAESFLKNPWKILSAN